LEGFGFSVLTPEQHFPQQAPHAQAITHLRSVMAPRYSPYGWRVDGLGLRSYGIYEPPDRFWLYQGIESGTYLTLAILLFLGAWWQVRYRSA
jgi:hypothetical protein